MDARTGNLNEEVNAVSFAIAGHLEEYDFGLFNQRRHSGNRFIQSGEEIVPVQGYDELRPDLFNSLGKEFLFRFIISLGQTGYTQKQDITPVAVQLMANVVEAGTDDVCLSLSLDNEVK